MAKEMERAGLPTVQNGSDNAVRRHHAARGPYGTPRIPANQPGRSTPQVLQAIDRSQSAGSRYTREIQVVPSKKNIQE